MKKQDSKKKSLILDKLQISKLKNSKAIVGGNDGSGTVDVSKGE